MDRPPQADGRGRFVLVGRNRMTCRPKADEQAQGKNPLFSHGIVHSHPPESETYEVG
jgi:hypothetical protein